MKTRARTVRKLLVASLGVATVSFVGTGCGNMSVANLMAPPSCDVAPTNPYCIPSADAGVGVDAGHPGDGGGDAKPR